MPKFTVYVTIETGTSYNVEAEDADEAANIAEYRASEEYYDAADISIDNVQELNED